MRSENFSWVILLRVQIWPKVWQSFYRSRTHDIIFLWQLGTKYDSGDYNIWRTEQIIYHSVLVVITLWIIDVLNLLHIVYCNIVNINYRRPLTINVHTALWLQRVPRYNIKAYRVRKNVFKTSRGYTFLLACETANIMHDTRAHRFFPISYSATVMCTFVMELSKTFKFADASLVMSLLQYTVVTRVHSFRVQTVLSSRNPRGNARCRLSDGIFSLH